MNQYRLRGPVDWLVRLPLSILGNPPVFFFGAMLGIIGILYTIAGGILWLFGMRILWGMPSLMTVVLSIIILAGWYITMRLWTWDAHTENCWQGNYPRSLPLHRIIRSFRLFKTHRNFWGEEWTYMPDGSLSANRCERGRLMVGNGIRRLPNATWYNNSLDLGWRIRPHAVAGDGEIIVDFFDGEGWYRWLQLSTLQRMWTVYLANLDRGKPARRLTLSALIDASFGRRLDDLERDLREAQAAAGRNKELQTKLASTLDLATWMLREIVGRRVHRSDRLGEIRVTGITRLIPLLSENDPRRGEFLDDDGQPRSRPPDWVSRQVAS